MSVPGLIWVVRVIWVIPVIGSVTSKCSASRSETASTGLLGLFV